jgi:hypothetical protein
VAAPSSAGRDIEFDDRQENKTITEWNAFSEKMPTVPLVAGRCQMRGQLF